MLEFEQWLEVEKVTHSDKPINEVLKDCWEYSAKKTKEDVEQSVIDDYEEQITDLENEIDSLASENDELTYECEDMENKVNLATKIIDEFLDFESSCMENGMYVSDELRNKAKQFVKEN